MGKVNFSQLLQDVANEKSLPVDLVKDLFVKSIVKAYRKQLGKDDDALIRVDMDLVKDDLSIFRQYLIVETVEDDFLEVELQEVSKDHPDLKVGDYFEEEISIDEFLKSTARNALSIFHQSLTEAEKEAIEKIFKERIGEILIGYVEKVDNTRNSIIVNLDRTSVILPAHEQIPGETFKVKDSVKLYLEGVKKTPRGALLSVTRRSPGFLKRLFEDIHEIYDGTVIIKDIAREAGERSKVAVYSKDPNVDPAGACIGQNGIRIQKIVAQLGNSKEKEKIDIIVYNKNPYLYIAESLKPAQVLGIDLDEIEKKATVVIPDEQSKIAIGRRGINIKLASKLTGYSLDLKEETEALGSGLVYRTIDEVLREEENRVSLEKSRLELERYRMTPTGEEINKSSLSNNYGEELTNEDYFGISKEVEPTVEPALEAETIPVETMPITSIVEEVKPSPIIEEVVEEKQIFVKTTKTLEELEEELAREKAAESGKVSKEKPRFQRREIKKVEPEEKKQPAATLTPSSYMNVYTEEELEQFDQEEEEHVDDDFDFDDYDDYYKDEK